MQSRYDDPLQRVVQGLPDPLLAALVSGLDRHGDNLMPGRLFWRDGRSCAVGAMLRELRPADFKVGRLRFWWRHGRRSSAVSYGGVCAECASVGQLERLYDESVKSLHGGSEHTSYATLTEFARTVGSWIHATAETELGRRHDRVVEMPRRRRRARAAAKAEVTVQADVVAALEPALAAV
jgi:hypothetical protein